MVQFREFVCTDETGVDRYDFEGAICIDGAL